MSEEQEIIKIVFDKEKNKCRIVSSNYNFIKCIIQHFTTENAVSFFLEQHGYNTSNEISVINALGYFDIGLFPLVYKALKEYYPNEQLEIVNKENILKKVFPLKGLVNCEHIKDISNTKMMRPYQVKAVHSALKYGRGIIECPTGSGKSLIIGNIIHNLNVTSIGSSVSEHIMIYVPTRQLVDQFYTDLLEYGFTKNDVCKFTSNSGLKKKKTFEDNSCQTGFKKIIITNRDYLNSHKAFIPKIGVLICDEVHTLSPTSKALEFINNINTDIKIGFTGTVPTDDFNKWSLIGIFGIVLFTETIINLQEQNYLAPLKIVSLDAFDYYVHTHHDLLFSLKTNKRFDKEDLSDEAMKFNEPYNAEIKYINENLYKLYKKPLEHICNSDNKNILILFDRTEFGKGIYEEAKNSLIDKEIYFIDGSIDIHTREKIRAQFEKTSGGLVFAQSKTFSTGINISNLDCIAFFFSGKGHTKIIQSIGRTLRLHKDKKYATLYDVSFNYKYSQKHKAERISLYSDAYGKESFDEIVNITI